MDSPQPIETAPRDGTVILTDRGVMRYVDQRLWGSPVKNGWASCDPNDNIFDCADNGMYYDSPTKWVPLPDWMR